MGARRFAPAVAGLVVLGAGLAACSNEEPPDWLAERATSTTAPTASTSTTAPPPPEDPEPGRDLAAIDLTPGMCIEEAGAITGQEVNEITQTRAIPCRLPHEAEVYARDELAGAPDAPFPGVGPLRTDAQEACRDGFEAFVGVPWTRSELEIAALWPSPPSWAQGDRLVVCAVFRLDGEPMTGSAEGSQI
jgi:hypothetical protein